MNVGEDRAGLGSERAILAAVGLTVMLVPLNSTMIAVALPRMMRDLDAGVVAAGWLVTAYLITMAALQPVAGKLGDRFGRRPFILGGLALFGVASAASAMAPGVGWLIVFRCLQAVAGAVAFPNGSALLREVVPIHRRASRFGLMGALISLGAAAGPPAGGLLITAGGWPAIFWVNLPLVAAVMLLGWRVIPTARPHPVAGRFDVAGAVILSAVLAVGAWALYQGRMTTVTVIAGALSLAGGVVFVRFELAHADPVVQPRFFRRPVFAAATGAIALSNLSLYSLLLAVPQLLSERGGWSERGIGLTLSSLSVAMLVLAPVGGWFADRMGRRWPAAGGLSVMTVGLTLLAWGGRDVTIPMLVTGLACGGIGLGMSSASLTTSAIDSVDRRHAGMASAASSTSRYLGSIVGTSVMAGLLSGSGDGYRRLFVLVAAAAGAAVLAALVLPAHPMIVETDPARR